MRAVIIATGDGPGITPLDERYPVPMLPLMDRPFIQHVVEYFARQGVTQFDFVLSHLPEKIEHHLGDGKRWGCRFTYHLARDPRRPYRVLKALDLGTDGGEPLLFGHADRLPAISLDETRPGVPVLFCWRDDLSPQWTGWALLSPEQLAGLPDDADEDGLRTYLHQPANGPPVCSEAPRPLSVRDFGEWLNAHQRVLEKQFTGLLLTGREVEPGIWLSRNVTLHPTAAIVAPVCVGENSAIGAGVKLGPHAVVGNDCVLDSRCTVSNSVVLPGSYVGPALELTDALVDRNRLVNARLGGVVTVAEDFLLGSLADRHLQRWLTSLMARGFALLLLLLASPVLLLTILCLRIARRGPVVYKREAVRLPAPLEEGGWCRFKVLSFADERGESCGLRGLLCQFLPGLVNVVRGELCFVGVPPRSRQEIDRLPPDWRSLYLCSKPGLVTEAAVRYESEPGEEELYAAEAYYAATANWTYDGKLLGRYLARCLLGFPASRAEPASLNVTGQ